MQLLFFLWHFYLSGTWFVVAPIKHQEEMYLTNMTNPRLTLNKQKKKKGEGGGVYDHLIRTRILILTSNRTLVMSSKSYEESGYGWN